ncbi:hypothetical protein N5T66_07730 [Aliarcobacter cryaerophilus]|uniref:hypothetical protein n=1 Tax=Aliarcobacter cryaerophilus TaxID=28198 RepID=UPI0021B2B6A6|nr:hypothetical protein [Aliarcobacter cryaerophilus]MCT7433174.1 hypothetical protein [Aliarcobacter cryaerophilus]
MKYLVETGLKIEKNIYFNLTHKFETEIFNAKDIVILFKFDNVNIPAISELDQRNLSGFIKKIILK